MKQKIVSVFLTAFSVCCMNGNSDDKTHHPLENPNPPKIEPVEEGNLRVEEKTRQRSAIEARKELSSDSNASESVFPGGVNY